MVFRPGSARVRVIDLTGEPDRHQRDRAPKGRDAERFFVKDDRGLRALPHWLKDRQYNDWSYGSVDARGNALLGLSWTDGHAGNPRKWEKRGLIVIVNNDQDLLDRAEAIVRAGSK